MLSKIIKLIPNKILVKLYTHFPVRVIKNWVVHRTQQKFIIGVTAIILNDKQEVLLLYHNYRDKKWGLPSGWLEDEQPMDGMKREIVEECGLDVILTGIYRTDFHKKPKCINIIFSGMINGGDFRPSDEIDSCKFCSFDQLPDDLPESQKQILKQYSLNL